MLYHLLQARLPKAAIISIGHRSTLFALHRRHLALRPEGDGHRLQEAPAGPVSAGEAPAAAT